MRKLISLLTLLCLFSSVGFSIMVTDSLSRGRFYKLRFRLKSSKESSRYLGLYTQKSLNADLFIYDEQDKLLAKVSGVAGKYPKEFKFPSAGIYTAKVVAYSGSGPFLMLISNREELKKILKDVK